MLMLPYSQEVIHELNAGSLQHPTTVVCVCARHRNRGRSSAGPQSLPGHHVAASGSEREQRAGVSLQKYPNPGRTIKHKILL